MSKKKPDKIWIPELSLLEQELKNEENKKKRSRTTRKTVFTLVTVAAVAVLVAILWMPVLRIYGSSMTPTLYEGNVVLSLKAQNLKPGDIIAFYYNNEILVKRLVGVPGDWIDIDQEGNVYLNGELLDEPYVKEKSFGECDIRLPYQVPENRIFVLGDHRSVSIDSRSKSVGCVANEQIVGKISFRIWPLTEMGTVE